MSPLTYFGALSGLYNMNIEIVLVIPIAYFCASFGCLLLREFTRGKVRYALATLYLGSSCFAWYALLAENKPWQFVIPLVTLLGGATGLWRWISAFIKDLHKI